MKYITRLLDKIDKEAFAKDYYDYALTTSEVARRHGVKHTNYVASIVKSLGLKTRKEIGTKTKKEVDTSYNQERIYGLNGCNFTCEKWKWCNKHNPVPLPCELYQFEDEVMEFEDSTLFYICPIGQVNLKVT